MRFYRAGGKGYGQRMPHKPSWVGLEVIERGDMVKFKTRSGYKFVPVEQVEKYERETGEKV